MSGRTRILLFLVFALTGFSALTLQVVWQRVISVHAGVDLVSFTTVVAAFLAGLGLGNLAGGALADRLGPRHSLAAFAVSNTCIGLFAWVSLWLFYDVYSEVATDVPDDIAKFGFNFLLVLFPTTLMGLSLPLVARGVVERIEEAAGLVGRLYAVNTLGAAAGAAVSGWVLLGSYGFETSVRIAGTLNLVAAALVAGLWTLAGRAEARRDRSEVTTAPSTTSWTGTGEGEPAGRRVWPWFAVYALTGAVALGFELVFFRLIDSVMRSNSYSFAHVLTLYLTLFGVGSAIGSRLVRRVRAPARWFLGLQFSVGLAALAGVLLLVQIAPRVGLRGLLRGYFGGEGFNTGFDAVTGAKEWAKLVFAYGGAPLLLMGVPVLLMGASFPLVAAVVSERVDTLGRRTGTLLFANIAGNVIGTLLVGFVLIDVLGTAVTMVVLASLLLLPGLAAAWADPTPSRRPLLAAGALVTFGVAAAAFPSNEELWAFIHGVDPGEDFELAEDRSCVTAFKQGESIGTPGIDSFLYINASGQNGHPWDDFHVLVGLTPALVHSNPTKGMAVGLGMGGTAYAIAADQRVDQVDAVELCGGQITLLERLVAEGSRVHRLMFANERLDLHVDDGREFLLRSTEPLDVVTVDVLRPQSAFSGGLYSVEFYELVRSRMSATGLMAQWVASTRVLNTITSVYPHVLVFNVPSYAGSQFVLASSSPIDFDPQQVLARLRSEVAADAFEPTQRRAIEDFFASARPVCVRRNPSSQLGDIAVNRDLRPRDEYFLNNDDTAGDYVGC